MKLRKLGLTLLLTLAAAGMTLGLTSCSADHTVGYIYVLGTQYNQINVFRESNNNGTLFSVTAPLSSGGTFPIRALTAQGSRFLYVLNQGAPVETTIDSGSGTQGISSYTSSNVTLFSIGGYGQLSQQLQYPSQGIGSQRIAVNSAGNLLFVLDKYAPQGRTTDTAATVSVYSASETAPANYPCQDTANPHIFHPVGAVTVFSIDPSTGRLQVQVNQRQQGLSYFPVGCNPVDFHLTASYLYTMDAGSPTSGDVQTVNVLAVAATGQLTPTQTSSIFVNPGGAVNISAINGDNSNRYIYLIDSQYNMLYLYTIGANGALTAITGSPYMNVQNSQAGGPVQSIVDSTGKFLYVINGGTATGINSANADVGGYDINQTTGYLDTPTQSSPTNLSESGTVSGPVCIFEDPTNQYIYVAGSADNSITGRRIDPNDGVLTPLNGPVAFPTVGTPSWCLGISSAL